jgi:hypothetical protein
VAAWPIPGGQFQNDQLAQFQMTKWPNPVNGQMTNWPNDQFLFVVALWGG